MTIIKTEAGWTMDITHRRNGCLEQGGLCGRRVLYTRATLTRCGIDYDAEPNDHADYLYHHIDPDRVLRRGVRIE
jgi:hypothetical protein